MDRTTEQINLAAEITYLDYSANIATQRGWYILAWLLRRKVQWLRVHG